MLFPTDSQNRLHTRLTAERFAICLLLVCSLQIMENLLPRIPIFPWLRIGLAYWIILPFLLRFGVLPTLALFLLRNLMTLIYGGQVFSAFLISSLAGLVSLGGLGFIVFHLYHRKTLGLLGSSLTLALGFNLSQLIIVDRLLIQHSDFYFQLAPICLWSMISGTMIALLVFKSRHTLEHLFGEDLQMTPQHQSIATKEFKSGDLLLFALTTGLFVAIVLLPTLTVQLAMLCLLLVGTRKRHLKLIYFAWPFYFYIAWLHLFRTDGVYIVEGWITHEGLEAFVYHTIRMTSIILCGQWLARYLPFLFNQAKGNRYLLGTGYALPILPSIFGLSIALGRDLFYQIKNRQFEELLSPVIASLLQEFEKLKDT